MDKREMESCLNDIVAATNRVYARERHWGFEHVMLMSPADEGEINSLSATRPFPLPPSYVQFLSLHNGCLGFWPRFALLGTGGECRDIVEAKVADALAHQQQFVKDEKGQITDATIAKFETPTDVRKCMYIPKHTVFGTNKRGVFLLFNEREVTRDGEFQVVNYSYDGDTGDVYPDFGSFLVGILVFLEQRIKAKKY